MAGVGYEIVMPCHDDPANVEPMPCHRLPPQGLTGEENHISRGCALHQRGMILTQAIRCPVERTRVLSSDMAYNALPLACAMPGERDDARDRCQPRAR
jgi:hypothetical protein